jgi:hypothetical protein
MREMNYQEMKKNAEDEKVRIYKAIIHVKGSITTI